MQGNFGGNFPMVDLSNLNLGGGVTNLNTNTMNNLNTNQNLMFDNLNLGLNNMTNLSNMNQNMNQINSFTPISTSEPVMKQIFKNNELTVYSQLSIPSDRISITGSFLVSNNLDKTISNIKMNLSVKKHVNCRVISTSGATLEPRRSLGLKKVNKY